MSIADGARDASRAAAQRRNGNVDFACTWTRGRSPAGRRGEPAPADARPPAARSAASAAARSGCARLAGALHDARRRRRRRGARPGLLYRSLPYLIDPEWTRGHRFAVAYVHGGRRRRAPVRGASSTDGGGGVTAQTAARAEPDAPCSFSRDTYCGSCAAMLTPNDAMRGQLTRVEGKIFPVRCSAAGSSARRAATTRELEREERQRELQDTAPDLGRGRNGAVPEGQGDPAAQSDPANGCRRAHAARRAALLSYERALRALGAPELEGPRDRLQRRQRALARHAARGADRHHLVPRLLLHRRGARDRRPRAVPAGRAQRRGRALPRHPAGRRGAPRRVLRPLRPR